VLLVDELEELLLLVEVAVEEDEVVVTDELLELDVELD
jgi:hypothetical protein